MVTRRALLELHQAAGDRLRACYHLRWLPRILWWSGQGPEAEAAGDESIAPLERFPESRELALALSGRSQLADARRAPARRRSCSATARSTLGAAHRRPGDGTRTG